MKLLFDENFGLPLMVALREVLKFSRELLEVQHIHELKKGGRSDAEWVPELACGGWLVITADRGKSAGPKLPELCRTHAITHVLVSGKLHNSPQFEKARAVLAVWPHLLAAAGSPLGTRFTLCYTPVWNFALLPQV